MKKLLLILLIAFTVSCEDSVDLCETNNCFVVKQVLKKNSPLGFWQTTDIVAEKQCNGERFTYKMGRLDLPQVGQILCIDESELTVID